MTQFLLQAKWNKCSNCDDNSDDDGDESDHDNDELFL